MSSRAMWTCEPESLTLSYHPTKFCVYRSLGKGGAAFPIMWPRDHGSYGIVGGILTLSTTTVSSVMLIGIIKVAI